MDRPRYNHPLRVVALGVGLALAIAVIVSQTWMIRWDVWLRPGFGRPWSGGWEFPAQSLRALLSGAAVLFAITGIGLGLIQILSRKRRMFGPGESLVLAPLVGAVPVSLVTLGVGLAGFASPPNMFATGIFFFVAAAAGWSVWFYTRSGSRRRQPVCVLQIFSIVLIAIIFALAIPYALSPVVQSDALRYHVAAPAQWMREGRIHYLPNQAFSNFPFLGEMLFMLAMSAGGYEAAQVVHLGMLPVCMGLIFLIALRWMRWSGIGKSRGSALAAAAGFALIPSVAVIAGWAFIDLFMAAYFLGFALVGAGSLSHAGRGRAVVLGIMIAGALSVKYSMLPLLAVLGVVWFTVRSVRSVGSVGSSIRSALVVAFVGLALASPWYVRNAVWTGNPVYPLAIKHFPSADWSVANEQFYMSKANEKGFRFEGVARAVAAPIELLITPYTVTYRPALFEDHIAGPLPLVALLVTLSSLFMKFQRSGLKPRRFLMICMIVSWISWFATYQATRMLFPTIGLVLAWSAAGAAGWERSGKPAGYAVRSVVAAAMLLSLVIFLMLMLIPNGSGTSNADALATGLGFQSRETFLARKVGYWQSARRLSREAAPGQKALLIGEHRPLYFDLPILVSDWFDTPQPVLWFRRSADNDTMLDRLIEDKVAFIFYNQEELNKYYESYFVTRLTEDEVKRFEALLPVRGKTAHHSRLEALERRGTPPNQMVIYRILPRTGGR